MSSLLIVISVFYFTSIFAVNGNPVENTCRTFTERIPYYASLGNCGGAVISKRWIVTAAHCVERIQSGSVWIGGECRNSSQEYRYDKVEIHPEYNPSLRTIKLSDIALLRLTQLLEFNRNVQPLQLPISQLYGNPALKYVGTVQPENSYKCPEAVHLINSARLSGQQCLEYLDPKTKAQIKPMLSYLEQAMFCVKRETKKTVCSGGSGAPLVRDNTLVGLASFDVYADYCHPNLLGLFTNVASYVPWIRDTSGL